jgi:signal transduction histidine kinase
MAAMSTGHWISLLACVGILGVGVLTLLRGGAHPLKLPLGLLCLDMFAWNFFTLARGISGAEAWGYLDATFSPFTPPLALYFTLVFVGRLRRYRWLLVAVFCCAGVLASHGAISLFDPRIRQAIPSTIWGYVFLALLVSLLLLELWLLLRHLRSTTSTTEKMRTRLVLASVLIGNLLGSTEFWDHLVQIPAMGHFGSLASTALLALVVFRLRLFVGELTLGAVVYALSLTGLATFGYLALARWLQTSTALLLAATGVVTLALLAAAREVVVSLVSRRERQQQQATLGRFSRQMAHDIKNPLAALKGALQFLQEEHQRNGAALDLERFLRLMAEQTDRLESVVERYHRLSRVEPRCAPLQLNQLAGEVLSQASQYEAMRAGEIQVQTELDPDLPAVQGDRDLLASVLENLVRNAIEAMPGGGRLDLRTARLHAGSGRPRVTLTVGDSGVGMDARQRERAFDDFFTTKVDGSGMGLSFACRVVEAHGGSVRLDSSLGRGTRITVTLPVEGPTTRR